MSLVCFLAWRGSRYFYVRTTCTIVTVLPAFSCLTAWASLPIYTRHLWSNTYYLGRIRSSRVRFYSSNVACLYLITESPKILVPYLRKSTVWNRCNRALLGQISYFLALPCSENLKISVRHIFILLALIFSSFSDNILCAGRHGPVQRLAVFCERGPHRCKGEHIRNYCNKYFISKNNPKRILVIDTA